MGFAGLYDPSLSITVINIVKFEKVKTATNIYVIFLIYNSATGFPSIVDWTNSPINLANGSIFC